MRHTNRPLALLVVGFVAAAVCFRCEAGNPYYWSYPSGCSVWHSSPFTYSVPRYSYYSYPRYSHPTYSDPTYSHPSPVPTTTYFAPTNSDCLTCIPEIRPITSDCPHCGGKHSTQPYTTLHSPRTQPELRDRARIPGVPYRPKGRVRAPRPAPLSVTDRTLLHLLKLHNVSPIDLGPKFPNAQLKLGQALFFDPLLSGNRDIACATCHHPLLASGDGLALPVGTGTPTPSLIGRSRVKGKDRPFIPRNAPEVFNRGSRHWPSQFWDSRVAKAEDGSFISPAGDKLPEGIINVLAVQAMFPVTSRDEMRGSRRDASNPARNNELAAIADDDFQAIWDALMVRLLRIPGYRTLFMNAYNIGMQDLDNIGFQHAANAMAAFESVAFGYDDSPFDEYLRGDHEALSESQKRGGILFYGKANCARCHSGTLLTDQEHYNLAVPQLGPGKDAGTGLDFGRFAETNNRDHLFCFRTPPLRNVTVTGPWMHNGAFGDLRSAVQHHLDPAASLLSYNPAAHLNQRELIQTVVTKKAVIESLVRRLELTTTELNDREFDDLMHFLAALTAPHLTERLRRTIPYSVPSGLLVAGAPSM